MKKIIPVIAILGSAAALIAYKLKKEEKKQVIDLDQGLLHDEDLLEDNEEIEEGPISETCCCAVENVKDAVEDIRDDVKAKVADLRDVAEEKAKDVVQAVKEFDQDFIHLLKDEVNELKIKADEVIDELAKEGDVHEHERPIQHSLYFHDQNDMNNFKNEVINKGFVITKGDEDNELMVLHITPINKGKLISNILYLADEARANNGTYGGWSSKVIY